MRLTEEQCNTIMKDAFKDKELPKYVTDDINRVFEHVNEITRKVVELRIHYNLTFYDIGNKLKITTAYASNRYRVFIHSLVLAAKYNWKFDGDRIISKDSSIEDLELSLRAYNPLRRADITTVGKLCEHSIDELKNLSKMGSKSIEEIINRLDLYGFKLKNSFDKEILKDKLINLDNTKSDLNVSIVAEALPIIYNKCINRVNKHGYEEACSNCCYKSKEDCLCIFNPKPKDWV